MRCDARCRTTSGGCDVADGTGTAIRWRKKKNANERGASLVEFAILLPLLLTLLFGIMEAGWAFSLQSEIRHGAREGARLVATDTDTGPNIVAEVCNRMHFSGDNTLTTVDIQITGSNPGVIGDTATVIVVTPYNGITGMIDVLFTAATITSEVDIRLEQNETSLDTGVPINCT